MKGYTAFFEQRMWVIYKITNPIGGCYVGKTCDYHNRMSSYRNLRSTKQPLLNDSFLKYGYDNHYVDILETFFSNNEYAKEREVFWIKTYMSNNSKWPDKNGLNLTDGHGGLGVFYSEERREKQRLKMLGKPQSEYQKKRMSEVHKGHKYNVGRKHTPEHTEKISSKTRGRKRTKNQIDNYIQSAINRNGKKIIQVNSQGVVVKYFLCIQDACKYFNVSDATIHRIIKNKGKNPYAKQKTKNILLHWAVNTNELFTQITFQRRIFKQQEIKVA